MQTDNPTTEAGPSGPVEQPKPFAIGDKVKFVRASSSGRSINMRSVEGIITKFSQPLGLKALIKYRGTVQWELVSDLRRIDQPSALMDILKSMGSKA